MGHVHSGHIEWMRTSLCINHQLSRDLTHQQSQNASKCISKFDFKNLKCFIGLKITTSNLRMPFYLQFLTQKVRLTKEWEAYRMDNSRLQEIKPYCSARRRDWVLLLYGRWCPSFEQTFKRHAQTVLQTTEDGTLRLSCNSQPEEICEQVAND